jgi:hemerythrin
MNSADFRLILARILKKSNLFEIPSPLPLPIQPEPLPIQPLPTIGIQPLPTPQVHFVCVCVLGNERDGKALSTEMDGETGFEYAINGYVARQQDMPRYGQLGCQGFIVFQKGSKASGEELIPYSLATSAFMQLPMQLKGLAFKHVEVLLGRLLNGNTNSGNANSAILPPPAVGPGEIRKIQGLQSESAKRHNGSVAVCVGVQEAESSSTNESGTKPERFHMAIMQGASAGTTLSLKAVNLVEMQAGCDGGGCDGGNCDGGGCDNGNCGDGSCGDGNCGDGGGCGTQNSCGDNGSWGPEPATVAPAGSTTNSTAESDTNGKASNNTEPQPAFSNPDELEKLLHVVVDPESTVGIEEIDREHGDLIPALRDLAMTRSLSSLVNLWEQLKEHFAHEEEIMGQLEKKSNNNEEEPAITSSFSATSSHTTQHKKLLQTLREEIAVVRESGISVVDAGFARSVVEEFCEHVRVYDRKIGLMGRTS